MALTEKEIHDLEDLIDSRTIEEVLNAISYIYAQKADHIFSSYVDKTTALVWAKLGDKLRVLSDEFSCRP